MKTIEIKNRFTNAVLFAAQVEDDDPSPVRTALIAAVRAGRDPDVLRAELAEMRAQMDDHDEWDGRTEDEQAVVKVTIAVIERELASPSARAYLADADLAGANLARAYLAGANLARAYLAGADLAGANLAGANLADANLADAKNVPDGVSAPQGAQATETAPAISECERLAARARRYREHRPDVPVVEDLDKKILTVISDGGGVLEMGSWHGEEKYDGTACGTTHCRAGWAIHLAGPAGYALEKKYGPECAGAMIYRASTGRVPYFFGGNAEALRDIKRRAAETE